MPHHDWLTRSFHDYESKLVHYAWSIVGDMETARDIAQDAFLKLCRETPASAGDPPRAWLYKTCRHRAIDHYRHRQRHATVSVTPDDDTLLDETTAADGELMRREDRAAILRALSALPEREQEIVRLKFLHEMSYQQIAATVGLSAGNVGYILHGALGKIRERMNLARRRGAAEFSLDKKNTPPPTNQKSPRLRVSARDLLNLFSFQPLTGATV